MLETMNAFTIKDIENLSGIKAHTIRIWEQRYSFLRPQRTETNIRYYTNDELKIILNIALLNKYGYKISHIDKMSETDITEKVLSLSQAEAQQERIVNSLIKCMIELDMKIFEEEIDMHIRRRGIEKTIEHIIFPFLERIGVLWQTGHITPAQEHLVSNLIRQKLIVGIDSVRTSIKSDKSFLLFLPEGEYHEMGLLFVHYLLKSRGADVLYLGSNVPLKDVQSVLSVKNPDYVYIHLTSTAANFSLERFLNQMVTRLGPIKTIISGPHTKSITRQTHPHIIFKRSLGEVLSFITGI